MLDRRIKLKDYDGPLRQLTITDLGHEPPTLLLTNQLDRAASQLISHYAQRMLIENNIEDGIDFFHMDALSSAVAMKINCDLQLTLMASSLYRLLAVHIGNGYEIANRGICSGTSSTPRPVSRSRTRRSWSGSTSEPIIRCWSRPSATRRTRPSPGWAGSSCGSSLDEHILAPRPSVV